MDILDESKRSELMREWETVCQDLRHFGQKRFLILPLTLALNGYLISSYLDLANDEKARNIFGLEPTLLVAAAGFLGTLILFMVEVGNHRYVTTMLEHGRGLEARLGTVSLLTKGLPPRNGRFWFLTTTFWNVALYVVALGVWAAAVAAHWSWLNLT